MCMHTTNQSETRSVALRPAKTRKHVSRNTHSARMFPQCFPVLPHGKHCFQRQFCFQEAKIASAIRQNISCFHAARKHGKTRKKLQKHVSSRFLETWFLVFPGLNLLGMRALGFKMTNTTTRPSAQINSIKNCAKLHPKPIQWTGTNYQE